MAASRRVVPILAVAVVAIGLTAVGVLVIASSGRGTPAASPERVAVPPVERRTPPPAAPSGADDCAATVEGGTPEAVADAVEAAGAGTVCFPEGRYEGPFAATVAGQRWKLDHRALLAGPIAIKADDVWIEGGTVSLPSDDPWAEGIHVDGDRATIQGVTFDGGGLVISVKGRDETQILDNTFGGQSGTAIFVWGEGRGADNTLIEGNTIDQANARKASPISSRGAEDGDAGNVVNRRITVRGNTIDQGDENTGWFGVELKLSPDAVIVDNDIRGCCVLVSLPDSDGTIVSGNRLDLRGGAGWGVEIASSDDVTVEDNTFTGDGPGTDDAAVSMNSGSLRALITANRAVGLGALVNLTGNNHRIVDNCIVDVRNITAYRLSAGPDVDVARNGPCA